MDERDNDGNTTIHIAASCGDPQALLYLLNLGGSVDALNKKQRSPLVEAIASGSEEAACLLIEMGANYEVLGTGSLPPSVTAAIAKKRRANLQFDESEGMKSMFL